jgi:hypothetical protein
MLTFGVSAKARNDAIGYFGTGFKYAVAIVLRLGGKISVTTQDDAGAVHHIRFLTVQENIRGEDFQCVKYQLSVNGVEQEPVDANFTTRLGITWAPWMALRELYCNAMDEHGQVANVEPEGAPQTVVTVDSEQLMQEFTKLGAYFIFAGRKPIYSDERVDIYEGASQFLYYRGVAVMNAPKDTEYTYNVKRHVELTEDRMCKYSYVMDFAIQEAYQNMQDGRLLRAALQAPSEKYEGRISFRPNESASEKFVEIASDLLKVGRISNDSIRRVLSEAQARRCDYPARTLNSTEQQMLDRAKSFLAKMDINIDQYEVICCTGMGDGIMGRALDGKIYLSEIPFDKGTKQVASTLLEEFVHLKHGCGDFDRRMQDWLFDKVISVGENINGEPL